MSVLITYKPKGIDLENAQKYILNVKNDSDDDWVFYVYQTMEEPTSNMLSLAWFASPYSIAPGDDIDFKWQITYNFVWGDTGELKPGITYKAKGSKDANLETANSTTFGYNDAGSPSLTKPEPDPNNKGSLVINDLGNIPSKKFSVGIGMSGTGTFVAQAGPNLHHFFTPTPVYWVGAATERKVGDVLDITTVTQNAKVEFPRNQYEVKMKLNKENKWELNN